MKWLFVIARNSSFTYKGKSTDIRQVGRELGVRYLLEGSVRKAGNRVRITAQLIDANGGNHVWAERYDRALEDVFAVQDEITRSIIGAIAPGIVAAEIQRTHGKKTEELGQWERVMRAHWHVQRFTRDDFNDAIDLIDEVLQSDPTNTMALADLAYNWHMGGLFGWTKEPLSVAMERMGEAARRAVAADDQEAAAQTTLAVYELFTNQHDDAIRRLHRAIELDPNSSFARGYLGAALSFAGEPDRSLAVLQEAMRLSPRDPFLWIFHATAGDAEFNLGHFDAAIGEYRKALETGQREFAIYMNLAAAYAQAGQLEEARVETAEVLRINPAFTIESWKRIVVFKDSKDLEHYVDGLRKAGLPDT